MNCGDLHGDERFQKTYHNNLSFNLTGQPGVWVGKWPIAKDIVWHDTLVDVGPVNDDGQYAWVLEFQCNELLDATIFVGINFYSSVKDHRYLDDFKAAAEKYGLHQYLYPDHGPQLTLVNQTGCLYNNTGADYSDDIL